MTRYVGWSVGCSVGRLVVISFISVFSILGVFCITAPAQMLESYFLTAPAHPHATSVAVYTALFSLSLGNFSIKKHTL